MAERDPFGREVGEDPLANLGWRTGEAEPQGDLAPVEEPSRSVPRRRRSGPGAGAGVAVAIVAVVLLGGAAVVGFVADVADDIGDVRSVESPVVRGPEGDSLPIAPSGDEPAEPPTGIRKGSLLLRTNFAATLAALRNRELGRVHSLRVAPERIDAQMLTAGGRLRNVQVRSDGSFDQFSLSGPGFGHLPTVPFARIDSSAPFRLTARAARRLGRGADGIDYLVLSAPLGRQQWGAYFKSGAIFLADGRGRITRRL